MRRSWIGTVDRKLVRAPSSAVPTRNRPGGTKAKSAGIAAAAGSANTIGNVSPARARIGNRTVARPAPDAIST